MVIFQPPSCIHGVVKFVIFCSHGDRESMFWNHEPSILGHGVGDLMQQLEREFVCDLNFSLSPSRSFWDVEFMPFLQPSKRGVCAYCISGKGHLMFVFQTPPAALRARRWCINFFAVCSFAVFGTRSFCPPAAHRAQSFARHLIFPPPPPAALGARSFVRDLIFPPPPPAALRARSLCPPVALGAPSLCPAAALGARKFCPPVALGVPRLYSFAALGRASWWLFSNHPLASMGS